MIYYIAKRDSSESYWTLGASERAAEYIVNFLKEGMYFGSIADCSY
jgi:hypothetical protein